METDFPCGAPRIRDLTRERQRKQSGSGEPQTMSATLRVLTERFEAMLAEIATHSGRAQRGARMADEDLKAELERLQAENARLKRQQGRTSLKVSEKGGVSVYGLGRFPVTLYKEQWTKLLAMADDIRAFITEHDAELKTKPDA
jgi:hypothetical protein